MLDMAPVFGLDFDNTIAIYDNVAANIASERGLIDSDAAIAGSGVKAIRDHIRSLDDGEVRWQELQAEMYGSRISESRLAPGVRQFIEVCAQNDIQLAIVSHKTQFARRDVGRIDLRDSATRWLTEKGLIGPVSPGIPSEMIFFEGTRATKLDRIRDLNCTLFIDDLPEVFTSDTFPDNVERILYAPHGAAELDPKVVVKADWGEIIRYLFPEYDLG